MLKRNFFYHGTDSILKKIEEPGIWATDIKSIADHYGQHCYILNLDLTKARICVLPFSIVEPQLTGKKWLSHILPLDDFDIVCFMDTYDHLPGRKHKTFYNQIFIKAPFIREHYRHRNGKHSRVKR